MNNNIEMVKKHLEYNGYKIDENEFAGDSSFIGFSQTYGALFLRPIGENGCRGIRLEKYFPINLKDNKGNKKISLFEMVNEMNKNLTNGTVFLYENKGMIMTSGILGGYDKSTFSDALDIFHMDSDSMYDFDLKTYWEKRNENELQ